jgi:hypothetical protein
MIYNDPFGVGDLSITPPDNATTASADATTMQNIMNSIPTEVVSGGSSISGVTQEYPTTGGLDIMGAMMRLSSPNAVGGQVRADAQRSQLGPVAHAPGENMWLYGLILIVLVYFFARK